MEKEQFVIHLKIEGGSRAMKKALERNPKETIKELCKKVSQMEFELDESSPTPEGEYLTINELCKLLKIGRMTIWRHSKKGILKPRKIGSRVLFARADIDEYLKEGGEHGKQ